MSHTDNFTGRKAKVRGKYVEDVYRDVVYYMHKGLCIVCGQKVDRHSFSIDHIVPASKGGTHEYSNVAPCHFACNALKGDKYLWQLKPKKHRKGHRRGKPWKMRRAYP